MCKNWYSNKRTYHIFLVVNIIRDYYKLVAQYLTGNEQISQMRAPLGAHHEPAVDQNRLSKLWYVFEHKK